MSYLPKKHKKEVSQVLAGMFAQVEESKAREHLAAFKLEYEKDFPEAVKCLQEDLEACLTCYQYPRALQKHLCTTLLWTVCFQPSAVALIVWGYFKTSKVAY